MPATGMTRTGDTKLFALAAPAGDVNLLILAHKATNLITSRIATTAFAISGKNPLRDGY
jgi:hypothetical protein